MPKKLTNASMSEMSEVLPSALQMFSRFRELPPVHKDNPEEVAKRLDDYFASCQSFDVMPSMESMCLCLGITRQAAWKWTRDKYSEAGRLVSQGKDVCNCLLTQASMTGAVNPIYGIWQQKCNYSYREQQFDEELAVIDVNQSSLESQISAAGLIWDSETNSYIEG